MIEFLILIQDVFAWSRVSTDIVIHRSPIDLNFPLVKQELQMSLKIKGQIIKPFNARIISVLLSHLAIQNSSSFQKIKRGLACLDYKELNKANLKDDFPLHNIHIILNNTIGQEIDSFSDCFIG